MHPPNDEKSPMLCMAALCVHAEVNIFNRVTHIYLLTANTPVYSLAPGQHYLSLNGDETVIIHSLLFAIPYPVFSSFSHCSH